MKIAADRDKCVGSGVCVLTAEAVFDQDDDGIVVLKVEDVSSDDGKVRQAVSTCPSGALSVLDG